MTWWWSTHSLDLSHPLAQGSILREWEFVVAMSHVTRRRTSTFSREFLGNTPLETNRHLAPPLFQQYVEGMKNIIFEAMVTGAFDEKMDGY